MWLELKKYNDYLSSSIPPSSITVPFNIVINCQKGLTGIYVIFLMYYFNNFSLTPYIYLSLHGTYGILWIIKDNIFPDLNYNKNITISSALLSIITVLGPYWVSPYLIIKNFNIASPYKICSCISLHTLGCVTMMASDTQKFFVIKEYWKLNQDRDKKILIRDGWFKKSRNINYLGEMMIYLSYAILGDSHIPYFILAYIWLLLFIPNMLYKDSKMFKKPGGHNYYMTSNLLYPF